MGWGWPIYDKDDNNLLVKWDADVFHFWGLGQDYHLYEDYEKYFPDEDKIPWTPSVYTADDLLHEMLSVLGSIPPDNFFEDTNLIGADAQKVFKHLRDCVQENIDSLDMEMHKHIITYKRHCKSCTCDVPPIFPVGWDLEL